MATVPWLLCACLVLSLTCNASKRTQDPVIQDLLADNAKLKAALSSMQKSFSELSRQVMMQQTFVEERIRSDGSSGIKQVRHELNGDRIYFTPDQTSFSAAGIHDHSDYTRIIGMGELNAVINGVEFRTRHNDYRLAMPASYPAFNAQVDIPYPEVPPSVLSKPTVAEQVKEMKLWFKAFKDQDHSVRDYRKYFQPVLCYLEGFWSVDTETVQEPFPSERHFIDAKTYADLHEKVRFMAYAGEKESLENYAYLPTTIMRIVNGTPEFAQWNYKILCHPMKNDLPLSALEYVDDLSARMKDGESDTVEKIKGTRKARFRIRGKIPKPSTAFEPDAYNWGLLDNLMYEIPGKNNYGASLMDNGMGQPLYHLQGSKLEKINTAHYTRAYDTKRQDATGLSVNLRGYSDPHLFSAQTTHENIAAMSMTRCDKVSGQDVCRRHTSRYTWAIPLEIIYLTPLLRWNPFNIRHVASKNWSDMRHVVETADGRERTGGFEPETAYNGTHEENFYRTPASLFVNTDTVNPSAADSINALVGVLDPNGKIQECTSSGIRVMFPEIEGVGTVRTRYPIMPLHSDGEQTRKELEALKDMLLDANGEFLQRREFEPDEEEEEEE